MTDKTSCKTILITGATDGIGLATASMLASRGHRILLHGRNAAKLETAVKTVSTQSGSNQVETCIADLSRLAEVEELAQSVASQYEHLDILMNNAGIFRTPKTISPDGLDVRFAVNTIAPYLLTRRLLPRMPASGRIVNLSSAAQSPVDLDALCGRREIADDFAAYAQSKLAITMWSRELALKLGNDGPAVIAVNPGSMLGSKMVQEGFGVAGGDIGIGAEILTRAALADEFATASGQYFDNDSRQFASPHADALDSRKSAEVVQAIESVLAEKTSFA